MKIYPVREKFFHADERKADRQNDVNSHLSQCSSAPKTLYFLQCIHVFCVDLRTNSDYFPIQH